MESKKEITQEFRTLFHLIYVILLSIFGILLVTVGLISGWSFYAVILTVMGIAICWLVYILQLGTWNSRMWIYTVLAIFGASYFGIHPDSFLDVPMLLSLLIIILSANQNMKLIYVVTADYPLLFCYHVFISRFIGPNTSSLSCSRICLGFVCIIAAAVVSNMFIRWIMTSKQQTAEVERELEESRRENELFLAKLSHELRTPINAVNGLSEMLLRELLQDPDPVTLHKHLEKNITSIQEAGHRLYRQVSDIMDYSELITDRMVVSSSIYEPMSVINDMVSSEIWKKMHEQFEMAVDVQPDLPRLLVGDSYKLKTIMTALVDNAIKYTEVGGAYLYISCREESYGINLNIDLWDTGIGMDCCQLENVSKYYYQGERDASRKSSGLGLGMSIVRGMVNAMGGFVVIDSEPGKGTHVHVSIPQKVADHTSSLHIQKHDQYRLACYFNKDKYLREEVATYYYSMVCHVKENFMIPVDQVASLAALKQEVAEKELTHVVIASWEYRMDPEYFEDLAKRMCVVMFVEKDYVQNDQSHIIILRKPVFVMAIVNTLNATLGGKRSETKKEELKFTDVKALIVDDEPMNLLVAGSVLESYGIRSDTCLSGPLAIEKCMSENYDIIFMDHMMPEMDGIVAMKKIRELRGGYYKKLPIVILTANAVSGAREMFMKEGFDEFVSKPIEMNAMNHVLRKMLKTGGE